MSVGQRDKVRGVSLLLELLLGLSLVTVALLTVFHIFWTADASVSLADRTTQAHHLARRLLEETMAKPFDQLSTDPSLSRDDVITVSHTHRRGQALSTDFVYRVEVIQPPSGPTSAPELVDVLVTVSWKQGSAGLTRDNSIRLQATKGRIP